MQASQGTCGGTRTLRVKVLLLLLLLCFCHKKKSLILSIVEMKSLMPQGTDTKENGPAYFTFVSLKVQRRLCMYWKLEKLGGGKVITKDSRGHHLSGC